MEIKRKGLLYVVSFLEGKSIRIFGESFSKEFQGEIQEFLLNCFHPV